VRRDSTWHRQFIFEHKVIDGRVVCGGSAVLRYPCRKGMVQLSGPNDAPTGLTDGQTRRALLQGA
jgi:hypothetical protein